MIVGIYLAAGKSKRMGTAKLELPLNGKSLGSLALEVAIGSRIDKVLVITKEDDPLTWVDSSLTETPLQQKWNHVLCKNAGTGQSASLQCGVRAAMKLEATAVIVILADQPYITTGLLNQLIDTYKENKAPYVASVFKGIMKPPILIDASLFTKIFALKGDEGARRLFSNGLLGIKIEHDDDKLFFDVDTPIDYKKIRDMS